jgi:gliding motility-associated lipoprotein GldH
MNRNTILIFLLACSLLAGCMPSPYFQKEEAIPQNAWSYKYAPTFKFDITEPAVGYVLYFVIRHTQAYPYSNIWIWVDVKQPGDSTFTRKRFNRVLAEPSGKWLGRGMGEIYEQYIPLTTDEEGKTMFKKKGSYEIRFEQDMRTDPLPEVMNIGLRIEKLSNS